MLVLFKIEHQKAILTTVVRYELLAMSILQLNFSLT